MALIIFQDLLNYNPVPGHMCYRSDLIIKKIHNVAYQQNIIKKQLHSASSNPLYIPQVKTKARTRAFSVAAPTVWNSLPASVKSEGNIVSFRQRLKT